MKNRNFINSMNKIKPLESADSRMLSAILSENRRVRGKQEHTGARGRKKSRKLLCGVLVAALVAIGAISAGAISLFRPFFPAGLPVLTDKEAASATREAGKTENAKSGLFYKTLNSIDYFDTVRVSFEVLEPHMKEAKAVTAEVDFLTGESYESITPISSEPRANGTLPDMELYAGEGQITIYDNLDRTYFRRPAFARQSEEEELGKDALRVYIAPADQEDGTPTYVYRQDATNTTLSGSYCLFPQGLVFGCLTDFSLWEITGTSEFLGRNCVEIAGVAPASYTGKAGVETFTMCVDEETGILLKYEAKNEAGVITSYVSVTELSVDTPLTGTGSAPQEKYAGYRSRD